MLRSSRGRRLRSATTRARESRAANNYHAAVMALREGQTLRVSNRTDTDAGTVHAATARKLVAIGVAEHPPHPARPGWFNMNIITTPTKENTR